MIRIKVLSQKKNPILKRTDLMLMVDHQGQATPKTDEIIKKIAENFKTSPEKVEVVYIFSQKGTAESKVKARIWKEKAPIKKVKKKEEVVKEKPEEGVKKPEKKVEDSKELKGEKPEQPKGEERK